MKGRTNLIIISVIILVAIVVGTLIYLFPNSIKDYFASRTQSTLVPPAPTGNVNDLVEALLREISDEQALLNEEEVDAELILSDSKEISDFGQSINENEL
jgi:hypothetical protein